MTLDQAAHNILQDILKFLKFISLSIENRYGRSVPIFVDTNGRRRRRQRPRQQIGLCVSLRDGVGVPGVVYLLGSGRRRRRYGSDSIEVGAPTADFDRFSTING